MQQAKNLFDAAMTNFTDQLEGLANFLQSPTGKKDHGVQIDIGLGPDGDTSAGGLLPEWGDEEPAFGLFYASSIGDGSPFGDA